MIEMTHEKLQPYVDKGLLNKKTKDDFTIYCYSKTTFFEGAWDEVTKACRGLIFHHDKPVNHPFPKIFNIGETPETQLENVLVTASYHDHFVYHKVNGHLVIADYIPEIDKFLVHTKGSIDDNFPMIINDRDIFFNKCSNIISHIRKQRSRFTLMFESITCEDPHTLYHAEVERYGEETLVLLGGYYYDEHNHRWQHLYPMSIESYAALDNIPCAIRYDDIDIDNESTVKGLYEHDETEGYVVWFPGLDFRVKIKTTDYWKLRFVKDLTPQAVVYRFRAAGEQRLWDRYPEEIADHAVYIVMEMFKMFLSEIYEAIPEEMREEQSDKVIGKSKSLNKREKTLIFSMKSGSIDDVVRKLMKSRQTRKDFCEWAKNNQVVMDTIREFLISKIET